MRTMKVSLILSKDESIETTNEYEKSRPELLRTLFAALQGVLLILAHKNA